jgi:hypothetical protein
MNRMTRGRFPGQEQGFSQLSRPALGHTRPPISWFRIKYPDLSPLSSVEVKAWNFVYNVQYVFMAWFLILGRTGLWV